MANVQTILARQPFDMIDFDAGSAFELGTPDDLPTNCLLEGTGWTLFSFDFKRAEAVLSDIGADCDLSAAPFSYDLQYERATRLMWLLFADFIELSKQIRSPSRLVHLFNIGHCGSTLLHHVFNRADGVWCISELLFTFDAAMRQGDVSDEDIGDLLHAGLQFLRLYPGANDADMVVVKHFSQATLQIPVYAAADPSAKRLFLYREGTGLVQFCLSFCATPRDCAGSGSGYGTGPIYLVDLVRGKAAKPVGRGGGYGGRPD